MKIADNQNTLSKNGDARHFVLEAFKHLKAIGATGDARDVLKAAHLPDNAEGVATGDNSQLADVIKQFIDIAGQHRVWAREAAAQTVPA